MDEIKIGTPVYHVEEYRLTNYELKQKGFEGFDNYGLEVVESIVIAVTDTHFDTITEKRDIGSNTNCLLVKKKLQKKLITVRTISS